MRHRVFALIGVVMVAGPLLLAQGPSTVPRTADGHPDPSSFTKPWTAVLPMAKTDDQIYEYACHQGNCAMTGILRGARAGEKAR